MPEKLKIGSTNVVELRSLRDSVTQVLSTTAVVTCSVSDKDGAAVSGAQNLAMAYTGTPGTFRGTIPSSVTLLPAPYQALVIATDAGSTRRFPTDAVAEP